MKAILISLVLGFPIALIISWYVEITVHGILWDSSIETAETIKRQKGRTMDFVIIASLTVIIGTLIARPPVLQCVVGMETGPPVEMTAPSQSPAVSTKTATTKPIVGPAS